MSLLLALALPAAACDRAVLGALSPPPLDPSAPVVVTGSANQGEVRLVGARVVLRSSWGLAAWEAVLSRPEDEDEWLPATLGARRVERLDARHLFQQKELVALYGAVQVRRQGVMQVDWLERSDARIQSCWTVVDPTPWEATLSPWLWDGVAWLGAGLGGWDIQALPGGGSAVSYEAWTEAQGLPVALQSAAMTRLLPALMRAYEERVGAVQRSL